MSVKEKSPFFIIGNPRSGTSLFRLMLNYHSQIVVPPECGYIQWLDDEYSKVTVWSVPLYRKVSQEIAVSRRFDSWGVSSEEILNFLIETRPDSYAEVCACVHQLYAIRVGKVPMLWGDKNNYYINHLDRLQALYPDAKFLFLIRDPRDIFCSYKALSGGEGSSAFAPKLTTSVSEFCEEWRSNYDLVKALQQKLQMSGRTYIVRYEDLVVSPAATLAGVFNYLELGMESSVLDYYKDRSDAFIEPAISISWKLKTRHAPDPNNVGKYKEILSECEQREIALSCSEGMNDHRYL